MMLIATRLGLIACRYLANSYNESRYITALEIAEHYNMNARALMPALRQLTRVGILRSRVGGREPGFIFAKNPKEYTIYHILNALEGDVQFTCCKDLVQDLKCDCEEKSKCGIFSLFDEIISSTVAKLKMISIADYAKASKGII